LIKEEYMRGRKPQPLPQVQTYAVIPQFMYALLSAGAITPAAFALWAAIRLFARDQKRQSFSPAPVNLTNEQLAWLTGLCAAQVKNLLAELEQAHVLERQTWGSGRQLQLCAPASTITGQWISRLIDYPVIPKEEELALMGLELEAPPPPQALSREGGVGGTPEGLIQQPANQLAANPVAANPLAANPVATKAALVALLREHGAFAKIAAEIAETFIAAGITELAEAEALVKDVIRQVSAEGAQGQQVIARAMVRLRDGDWDIAALRDEAIAAAQYDNTQYHASAAPLLEAPAAPLPAATTVTAAPASFPVTRVDEGLELWCQALALLRTSTTTSLFDTWLHRTQALGFSDDGETLIVKAFNQQAVEVLSDRILPLVQRSLRQAAGREVPVRFVSTPTDR